MLAQQTQRGWATWRGRSAYIPPRARALQLSKKNHSNDRVQKMRGSNAFDSHCLARAAEVNFDTTSKRPTAPIMAAAPIGLRTGMATSNAQKGAWAQFEPTYSKL